MLATSSLHASQCFLNHKASRTFNKASNSTTRTNFNRRSTVVAQAASAPPPVENRGESGIDVNGYRPTSPKAWEFMSTHLRNKNLKFVTQQQVLAAAKNKNVAIVDIRPLNEYESGRIPGAINVQFFQLIQGWDLRRIARRATFAFFGILNGTEYNPNFLEDFAAAVPNKGTQIIICCTVGGTLEPTGPSEFGRQTRSLTAAYELSKYGGYTNISVLDGGFYEWQKEQDIESD